MPITITQITSISQVQGEVSKTEHGEEKRSLCRAGCYRIQKCVNASNEGSFTTIFEIKIGENTLILPPCYGDPRNTLFSGRPTFVEIHYLLLLYGMVQFI